MKFNVYFVNRVRKELIATFYHFELAKTYVDENEIMWDREDGYEESGILVIEEA